MAYGFYGFNMSQNPLYSRLFNPNVYGQAQSAYQTGMSQFTPYDARQAYGQKQQAPVQQEQQAPVRQGMKPTASYKRDGYLDERYANGLRVVTRPDGSKTVNFMSGSGGFNMDKSGQIVGRHQNGGNDELAMVKAMSLYNMLGL